MPAVGLYCMELEFHSNDVYSISKRINLYPWIRWNPCFSDRVITMQSDTELCHSSVVQSLSREIPCLTVSEIGILCDIPTVSKHLTDISSEQSIDLADDNILYKHAAASHLEAADELLSVLSDAVCLRVTYQDAKCHICLLQQHSADYACSIEASTCDLSVSHSSITSTSSPVELIPGNSVVDSARECQTDSNLGPTYQTNLCDARKQCSNQTVLGAVSSCCDILCPDLTQQCSSSSDGQVCNIKLLNINCYY